MIEHTWKHIINASSKDFWKACMDLPLAAKLYKSLGVLEFVPSSVTVKDGVRHWQSRIKTALPKVVHFIMTDISYVEVSSFKEPSGPYMFTCSVLGPLSGKVTIQGVISCFDIGPNQCERTTRVKVDSEGWIATVLNKGLIENLGVTYAGSAAFFNRFFREQAQEE
jgi:hypothetical protein